MRTRVLLALVLGSLALRLRAEDLKPPPEVRHLEYVHYQAGGHQVSWGVSHGTINEEGEYLASGDQLVNYSLDLDTGDMMRDGEHVAMSLENAYSASLVFQGLSRLMATYTDGLDETPYGTSDTNSAESGKTDSGDSRKTGADSAKQPVPRPHPSPAVQRLRRSDSLAQGPVRQLPEVALAAVVR